MFDYGEMMMMLVVKIAMIMAIMTIISLFQGFDKNKALWPSQDDRFVVI